MTDRIESTGEHPGDRRTGSGRLKGLVAVLLVLAVVLIAVQLLTLPRVEQEPPEITTDGLPPLAAREIAVAYDKAASAPQSAEAWGRLGMVLMAHRLHAQARRCFRYAQALDPSEFQWPYLVGISFSASDPPAALKPLREAIALRNDAAFAHVRLAELLLELDQLEESQQHLGLALQSEPNDLHALMASARLQLAREDLDSSLRWAEKAAQLGPHIRAAHELLARVYQRRGNRDAALRELAIADKLPDNPLEYNDPFVAQVLADRRETQQGLKQAQKLLAENRFKEAIELLGPAWESDPTDPDVGVPCELARALVQVNEPALAASVLDRAAYQHPTSALVRLQRGVLYFLQSDYQNAARSFGEAIERKPDYAVAYFYLGRSHDKRGNKAEAVSAFQAAVRLEPAYAAAYRSLGRVLLEQGQTEAAKGHLQTVLELVPGDKEAQRLHDQATATSDSSSAAPSERLDATNPIQARPADIVSGHDKMLARLKQTLAGLRIRIVTLVTDVPAS